MYKVNRKYDKSKLNDNDEITITLFDNQKEIIGIINAKEHLQFPRCYEDEGGYTYYVTNMLEILDLDINEEYQTDKLLSEIVLVLFQDYGIIIFKTDKKDKVKYLDKIPWSKVVSYQEPKFGNFEYENCVEECFVEDFDNYFVVIDYFTEDDYYEIF